MTRTTSSHDSRHYEDVKIETQESLPSPLLEGSAEEKALVRKLDKRIMPIACALYLFSCSPFSLSLSNVSRALTTSPDLDRSNLGNARLQGLPEDVLGGDPTGVLFDWITSAFFLAYILCQIPATLLSKLFRPRLWVAAAGLGWGTCATLMSTGFNFGSLLAARACIGVFESGFGAAIPLYFSFFYTRNEIGLRMACWFGFATVGGAFGGLIAFGIQNASLPFQPWRLLFIVEGLPPVVLAMFTVFLFPDRPESTTFLDGDERRIAIARMNRATSGDVGASVNKAHIWAAFCDWRIYVGGVIYFGLNCALASIGAFLPTIIQTFGNSAAVTQLLTVPPYAVAFVVLVSFSFASDRLQSRGVFMGVASVIGAIGYLLLLVVHDNVRVRYFATFCITSGTYTTIGLTITWFAHNLGSETKRATGIPIFMSMGQCGSVLGSHIFPRSEGPRYIKGFAITCALELLAAVCAATLSISYRLDNARRDHVYGRPIPGARVDTQTLADKAPAFRYLP